MAVVVELGDAMVLAELRDIVKAILILHHVADVAELSRQRARLAAELFQLFALRRIDAEAVIMRIADDEIVVDVHAQAAGPAIAIIGRGPGGAEIVAVAVVNLDARGEIDDVKVVLPVDGDGARPDHIAVLHALASPDDLRRTVLSAPNAGTAGAERQRSASNRKIEHGRSRIMAHEPDTKRKRAMGLGYHVAARDARGEMLCRLAVAFW